MGLYMYLYKRNYINSYTWLKNNERQEVIVKKDNEIDSKIKPERIKYVIEEVGYWIKANHIHNWFVNNVQDGKDDCGLYQVTREMLESLLDTCKKIKDDNGLAEELLPTKSGFFFGGIEYDDGYFANIDHTIKIIEECLSDEDTYEFEYISSW